MTPTPRSSGAHSRRAHRAETGCRRRVYENASRSFRSKMSTANGTATLTRIETSPRLNPSGTSSSTAEPASHAPSRLITTVLAHRRRHSTPMAHMQVPSASSKVSSARPAMKTSPASANGAAEIPAMTQKMLCISSSTNAASGRLDASALINLLHHLRVDVYGEWAARVVHDPHMQHRRHADVDRAEGARRGQGHQAELDAERREADVLMLMPCGERTARVGTELSDVVHLEHRADQHGPVLGVGVNETLRAARVHHVARVDVALVHPVRGGGVLRAGTIACGPRRVPVAIWRDGGHSFVVQLFRSPHLFGRCCVVRVLQDRARVSVLRIGPRQVVDPHD